MVQRKSLVREIEDETARRLKTITKEEQRRIAEVMERARLKRKVR